MSVTLIARTLAVTPEGSSMPTFDEWFVERGQAMLSFAWLVTRDRHDAQDALQEALAGLYPRWDRFTDIDDAEAYLKRSIANALVSNWRKARKGLIPVAEPGRMQPSVPDFTDAVDEVDMVWRMCDQLTPQQRAVVVLRFREDCSFADVARILDIPETTARSHVHRAVARLRTMLEDQR